MTVKIYECDDGHRWVAWKPSEEGKDNCPVCVGKLRSLTAMSETRSKWSGLLGDEEYSGQVASDYMDKLNNWKALESSPNDYIPLSPTGVEYMRGVVLDALEVYENSLTPQHF